MFHASAELLAALGTSPSLIKLLGLLSLDGLIEFGSGKLPDFMAQLFDLIPGQIHWRAVFAIGLGADHPAKFLHLLQNFRGEPRATFFYYF
jgi:hypothetical protein